VCGRVVLKLAAIYQQQVSSAPLNTHLWLGRRADEIGTERIPMVPPMPNLQKQMTFGALCKVISLHWHSQGVRAGVETLAYVSINIGYPTLNHCTIFM